MLQDRGNTGASSAFCPAEDHSPCARLYRYYAPGILAYLRRHVPTQEDAEDLLLDVFLAALEYEPRLAGLAEDEQRAWLATVARNKMIDHHRWASRRRFFSLERAVSTLDGEEMMPEEVVVRNEEHDRLRSYLQQLSATHWRCCSCALPLVCGAQRLLARCISGKARFARCFHAP